MPDNGHDSAEEDTRHEPMLRLWWSCGLQCMHVEAKGSGCIELHLLCTLCSNQSASTIVRNLPYRPATLQAGHVLATHVTIVEAAAANHPEPWWWLCSRQQQALPPAPVAATLACAAGTHACFHGSGLLVAATAVWFRPPTIPSNSLGQPRHR